jgi:hypothetical protein
MPGILQPIPTNAGAMPNWKFCWRDAKWLILNYLWELGRKQYLATIHVSGGFHAGVVVFNHLDSGESSKIGDEF